MKIIVIPEYPLITNEKIVLIVTATTVVRDSYNPNDTCTGNVHISIENEGSKEENEREFVIQDLSGEES